MSEEVFGTQNQRPCSVTLRGLLRCLSKLFHLAIKPLTVDSWPSRREEDFSDSFVALVASYTTTLDYVKPFNMIRSFPDLSKRWGPILLSNSLNQQLEICWDWSFFKRIMISHSYIEFLRWFWHNISIWEFSENSIQPIFLKGARALVPFSVLQWLTNICKFH